jgi:hypothetical protein
MPKAVIKTKTGATVTLEGTQDEVAALVARFEVGAGTGGRSGNRQPMRRQGKRRATPRDLISELIAEGYFNKPKELGAVKQALEERGHFYPLTHLSPVVLRLVKNKDLRRLKQGKRWAYVE